jgi:hypothetical protein
MAPSHRYSVASFATLRVMSCLHSPGLLCSCCNVVRFCCDLEACNWWLLLSCWRYVRNVKEHVHCDVTNVCVCYHTCYVRCTSVSEHIVLVISVLNYQSVFFIVHLIITLSRLPMVCFWVTVIWISLETSVQSRLSLRHLQFMQPVCCAAATQRPRSVLVFVSVGS